MANLIVGAPDFTQPTRSYTPSMSGGSWLAALPLANIASRFLHLPARSTTDAVADTVCTVDLGTARAVRCLAALTNISTVGTVRARGFVTLPILDALDFSTGWTLTGTPTRSAAAMTCDDGVPLDLIADDDAGVLEQYTRTVVLTGDGEKCIAFRLSKDTSAGGIVTLRDSTAGVNRGRLVWTWSGTVPAIVVSNGTLISSTHLGNGDYRVVYKTTSCTAANTHALNVSPATDNAASVTLTGNTYLGDVLLWNADTDQLAHDTGYELAVPSGVDAEDSEGLNVWWSHITDEDKTARYWRVNINDTTNPDTFIDVYRLVIAGGIQNEVNVSVGLELNFLDASIAEETDGGATIHDVRRVKRELVGVFEMMDQATAYGDWFAIKHRLGTHGQLLVCLDPDDADALRWKRTFLATQAELNGISHPQAMWHAGRFRFLEQL